MKNKYTVGEVAKLLNISAQTIRFYDKIGVVTPDQVDANTGYRYYSYDQIQYIGRIRYLQRFGFQLENIRSALSSNDVHAFLDFLHGREHAIREEIRTREDTLRELDWYINYYTHIEEHPFINLPYLTREPTRWLLAEPFKPGEELYGTAGKRLTELQNTPPFSDLPYLRQVGYLLDLEELRRGHIQPTHYYTFINGVPDIRHQKLLRIPGGNFFSVQARILAEPFEPELINRFLSSIVLTPSVPESQIFTSKPLVLANEYEDNFVDFRNCIYEIQISI